MWFESEKYRQNDLEDVNKKLLNIKGELEEKEAKITLAQFLYRNIGFSTDLISGIKLYPDQIINIKGMLNSNYSLCVHGRGVSKCVIYNETTQLLTKEFGLITLPKLIPNIDFSLGERWINIPKCHLWNGKKWVETTKILIQSKIPTKTLETIQGYSLTGSERHLIKVWNKELVSVEWKKYQDICIGDYICISRNVCEYPSKDNCDINESYLIGLLLGDGCLTVDGFLLTSADEEILKFCEKFPVGKRILDKRSKVITLRFSTQFSKYLKDKYNLKCCTSYTKEIPKFILEDKKSTIACLQGLFDTDGYAYRNRLGLGFCNTSEVLTKQIHHLLNIFGMISSFKSYKTASKFGKCYKINILGQEALNFYNQIGFRLIRKQHILINNFQRKFNTNKDIIPGLINYCKQFNKLKEDWPIDLQREWHDKIYKRTNQHNLTYYSLQKTIDFLNKVHISNSELDNLKLIKENNFFFDKVKYIKDNGNENCLDFNVPNDEMYWSNGFISHNTFTAAIFCILQGIFFPGSKILIVGPTFRTSRFIFNTIEQLSSSANGQMLFQALGVKSKRNDEFRWSLNGGEIIAIPCNGEKIRGFRANVLVIDEFLLMSKDMVERVLMPFLVVPQDLTQRQIIRQREDELIRRGILKESDRIVFPNNAKFVGLSSASFTCEYLYEKYDEFIKEIQSPKLPENGAKYFVSQMAWDAIPQDRVDKSIIELAQSSESNSATFKREYGAQFIDGSDSYFSMNKMIKCTIPDGESPSLLLKGNPNSKYILAIDPNISNSPTSDNFAMCVIEIDEEKLKEGKAEGTVVHNYARHGVDLKDHINYFYYIWKNFNIDMICIDHSSYQFIESVNESELFRDEKTEIKIFEFSAEKDGPELELQLKQARNQYNKSINRIAFSQVFSTDFIRKGNEHLQGCIDFKKIWFGSGIQCNQSAFERATSANVDLKLIKEDDTLEFIDTQEVLIRQMKYECASIEVKSTTKGTQSFDLPQIMKRNTSPNRMRKDSYTALMMGCWALKQYVDISKIPDAPESGFTPILI